MNRRKLTIALLFGLAYLTQARGEVILQYFNTSWNEIAMRMPEVAEAGYTALWLPPPFVAGSPNSVGYDTYLRFDYGTSAATLYGTADDLQNVVKVAHRFGLRVYFDNVMNQNGGPLPDTPPSTLSNTQPGFVPEDFHLLQLSTNTYSTLPSANENYNVEQQDLYLNQFGADIAQESPNGSFGAAEFDTYPKFFGIRQPNNPELYPDTNVTVATDGQGNAVHPFDGMGQPVAEDVNGMLIRAVRWFLDQSKCDGFRLDDVKGVPSYFFGEQGYSGGNKDTSTAGYTGAIQEQFNITHGYNSWSNLRATLFDDQLPRNNAMLWGEALGQPQDCSVTCEQNYIDAGMRVDDNEFYSQMFQAVCGGCSGGLWGLDQPGAYSFDGVDTGLIHVGVQDYNAISIFDRTSAHALILTRAGLPSVYTDGYNEASGSNPFPAIGDNKFLGQFLTNSPPAYLPNLCYINQLFARGNQNPKWSDQTYCAYERQDFRENTNMTAADATTLLFMMAQNGSGGQSRSYTTSFPVGARLINYSTFNNAFGFGATVATNGLLLNDSGSLIIAPAGGYWAFSWSVPGMPAAWNDGMFGQVQPITILQNGQPAGTMTYNRKDGVNGDPNFNPYSVSNAIPGSYQYPMTVPCITSPSNLTFIARADGSSANILMELDGGIDLNSQMGLGPQTGEKRDNAPGVATDVFLGYEQMAFVQRVAEMFAARDISRNIIGSPGCETYQATIGTNGFIVNNGSGTNTSVGTVTWVYHDPAANNQLASPTLQFFPAPQSAANQPITVWVKIGYTNQPQHAVLYYTTSSTTNGMPFPDGSAGLGKGTTQVATLAFDSNGPADGAGTPVWWKTTLPAMPSGTVLRYKVGVYRTDAGPWFPFAASDVALKQRMETIFQITNFNAAAISLYPHNDYAATQTGLDEGFHVLRTKTFLQRPGRASIYNLNVQTFYYDTRTPLGQILFPATNTTITSSNYNVVVRADRTTSTVWYRITDGNGTGQWAQAAAILPSTVGLNTTYPLEWRFNYMNIPTNGTAQIQARLLRLTSSTNMNLTDVAGHFTTLNTPVNTSQIVDSVGDGIPDSWRAQYFPNQPTNNANGTMTNNQSCAACDADGDGFTNLQKFIAGTDPTNPATAFRIISITQQPDGTNVIVWTSVTGKDYQVYATTDPASGYAPVGGTVPSAGTNTTYTDAGIMGATKYYKVKVVP